MLFWCFFVRFNFLQLFTYLIWLSDIKFFFYFVVCCEIFSFACIRWRKDFVVIKITSCVLKCWEKADYSSECSGNDLIAENCSEKLSLKIFFYGAVVLWSILLSSFLRRKMVDSFFYGKLNRFWGFDARNILYGITMNTTWWIWWENNIFSINKRA